MTKVHTGLSLILGKRTWNIANDSQSCNDGEPYKSILKMTGCIDGYFTCMDGQCVHMSKRCDQITHCKDKSDEKDCTILDLDDNYLKYIPPFNETNKTKVIVSMVFLSINDISEISLTIDLKFRISLEWYETDRVTYHNLKPILSFNAVPDGEMNQLWTPYIIYTNTDNNEATMVYYKFKDIRTNMAVTREGYFTRRPISILDEIELFKVIFII